MTRVTIAVGAFAVVFVLLVLAAVRVLPLMVPNPRVRDSVVAPAPAFPPSTDATPEDYRGFLYGRVTTDDGAVYEGRLRWGGDEEAFWGDYFNGLKDQNPWAAEVPADRLTRRGTIGIFGIEFAQRERQIGLERPFMARMGDIARVEAWGPDIRVTLKSGTVFDLDRGSADDLADGLRVWDTSRGVMRFAERRIRLVEFLPTAPLGAAPSRPYGTVRTRRGDFTGFLQWNREEGVGTDALDGYGADGELLSLSFDSIRSVARNSSDSSRVTLLDGREFVLSGNHEVGRGNRGVYVDDPRYGRVLVSWDAFERVDFSPNDNGPAFDDFPPGGPLTGSVTTRDGRHLAGRLVYDLDESETTETLDAPSGGVNYNIPFGLIASIVPGPRRESPEQARVILHSGEELELDHAGDLSEGVAGVLIFSESSEAAVYVPWTDIASVDFDRPPAMYPPLGGR